MSLLYACSSNPGKLREFTFTAHRSLVGEFKIEPLPRLAEITPPAEDGRTYEENASIKALYYSRFSDALVFADDSGLEVEALHGAPGIHSARFAGPQATGAQNNTLLLAKLAGITQRRARFVTAIRWQEGHGLAHHGRNSGRRNFSTPRLISASVTIRLFLFPPLASHLRRIGRH